MPGQVLSDFFALAADAIALAGPNGLSVGAAARAAYPSSRPARVRWLVSQLRAQGPCYTLKSDANADGGYIATASRAINLAACGFSTLEHPSLTDNALLTLSVLGAAGDAGILQAKLGDSATKTFQSAHHYLLALLAHDLVFRRRTTYARSKARSSDVVIPVAAGLTSRVLLTRYAVAKDAASVGETETVEEAILQAGTSQPHERRVNAANVFNLSRGLVEELQRRPLHSACSADLKNALIPLEHPRRHKNFSQAVRKLLTAKIVCFIDSFLINSEGQSYGLQRCLKLLDEEIASLPQKLGKLEALDEVEPNSVAIRVSDGEAGSEDEIDVGDEDAAALSRQLDIPSGAEVGAEVDMEFDCPTVERSGGVATGRLAESVLNPASSLMQESFSLLIESGDHGISVVDIFRTFKPFVETRLSKMLYKNLKVALAGRVSEIPKFIGRTRRLHLVYNGHQVGPVRPFGKETDLILESVSRRPASGAVQHSPSVPGIDIHTLPSGVEPFSVDTCSYMPSVLLGQSRLGRRRVQIVDYLVRNYHAVRRDKIGRIIGMIEDKRFFQVDRRVMDRIIDVLVLDKRGKLVSITLESPASVKKPSEFNDSADEEEDGGNVHGPPSTTTVAADVPFIVSLDFDEKESGAAALAAASFNKLCSDYPDLMKLIKHEEPNSDEVSRKAAPQQAFVLVDKVEGLSPLIDPHLPIARKPAKRSEELGLVLMYAVAVNYGFSVGLMKRAREFHLAINAYVFDRNADETSCIGKLERNVAAVFEEKDAVSYMQLRTFARTIGVFEDFGVIDEQLWETRVCDLPDAWGESLIHTDPANEQIAILLSCLFRLNLIDVASGGRWNLRESVSLRDYGSGIPEAAFGLSFRFSDLEAVTKFWETLELFKNCALPPENKDCSTLKDMDVQTGRFVVLEVYGEKHWGPMESRPQIPSFYLRVEECIQRLSYSPRGTASVARRRDCFGKLDALSKENTSKLLLRIAQRLAGFFNMKLLLNSLAVVVHYVNERKTQPASKEVQAQMRFLKTKKIKQQNSRKIASNPGEWLEKDLKLLSLVCEIRAVAEAQEVISVRSLDCDWYLRGIIACDPDDEIEGLWTDVSRVMGMTVSNCKQRFLALCELETVRAQFQASVVYFRSTLWYGSETMGSDDSANGVDAGISSGISRRDLLAMNSALFRASLGKSSLVFRQPRKRARSTKCPAIAISRSKRLKTLALKPAKGVASKPKAVVTRPSSHGGPALSLSPLPVLSFNVPSLRPCTLGILNPDVLKLEGRVKAHFALSSLSSDSSISANLTLAVICRVLLTVLREPISSLDLNGVVKLLSKFEDADLVRARERLLAQGRIKWNRSGSTSVLLLTLALPSDVPAFIPPYDVLMDIHGLVAEFESRLKKLVHVENKVADVVTSTLFRPELLASVQIAFFPPKSLLCSLEIKRRSNLDISSTIANKSTAPMEEDVRGGRTYLRNELLSASSVVGDGKKKKMCCFESGAGRLSTGAVACAFDEDAMSRVASYVASTVADGGKDAVRVVLDAIDSCKSPFGVRARAIRNLPGCSNLPLVIVVRVICGLVHERILARVIVDSAFSGRSEPVYMRCEQARIVWSGAEPSDRSDHTKGDSDSWSFWRGLSGQLDEKLCKLAQVKVIHVLTRKPGQSEVSLRCAVKNLNISDQVCVDILWALVKRGFVRRVFVRKAVQPCTLFSAITPAVESSDLDPSILQFVDGLQISGLDESVAAHYYLRGSGCGILLNCDAIASAVRCVWS